MRNSRLSPGGGGEAFRVFFGLELGVWYVVVFLRLGVWLFCGGGEIFWVPPPPGVTGPCASAHFRGCPRWGPQQQGGGPRGWSFYAWSGGFFPPKPPVVGRGLPGFSSYSTGFTFPTPLDPPPGAPGARGSPGPRGV
uniref:Uncharacterized protein n=1 Tax=Knipowitschia caucasica TaxID=637954 RepID=A0AAV2IUZ9_KNICA